MFICLVLVSPVVSVSTRCVTTDCIVISLTGSNSFSEIGYHSSVPSSACSDDDNMLITFIALSVVSPAGSITTCQDNMFCSLAGLFMSVVPSGLVTDEVVFSVTPDQHDISGSLDDLFISVVSSAIGIVSVVLVGSISGRSGRVSSGSIVVL